MLNANSSFWLNNYSANYNFYLSDSISQENADKLFMSSQNILSFSFNSSFVNQHYLYDYITKLSYMDTILINNNLGSYTNYQNLYMSHNQDIILNNNINFLSFYNLIESDYQDLNSVVLMYSPELSNVFSEFTYYYILPTFFNFKPSVVFDSYSDNFFLQNSYSTYSFIFFCLYCWFIILTIYSNSPLKWSNPLNFQFIRFYYYVYSMSKDIRIQLEVVLQTIVFFFIYWVVVLMTFDDNQEEIIEFVDTSFFYFFVIITLYICYKHSIHYFSFLEASVAEGRSVSFITKQVFKDFLNTLSLFLRFYILLLRVNVYDTLDDFLDSYYIFVGDFDEDEYINEVFISMYGSLLFLSENDYDTSFLMEDEHDFFGDIFYIYFITWGKLFYFMFFMLEEAARLSLAFYVCYLIIFEVHSVNCSYKEDNYFFIKRKN